MPMRALAFIVSSWCGIFMKWSSDVPHIGFIYFDLLLAEVVGVDAF